ncbi:amino acid ABC transporter ATP-binding/permease protein [Enterococcus alishanensis]|uniref:ABC transporter ATP-binding protein/permease n=1 Tax=Enterococcus alishanensis TaxID=1303817 RepID=A0ABS6T9S3_9ENTE|nr:ABC transporter ATP-binding protein [Enterococcus alishanensis]MBV7389648.1 ABC transporter ATP-binding protein/permease [Enterococcus alishanensis]
MKEKTIIRWLLSFVFSEKKKVALAVLLGIISNLAVIAIPIVGVISLLRLIGGEMSQGFRPLIIMVFCGVLRGVCRYLEQYLNHDIAFSLLADIRDYIFATVRRLGPGKLSGKNSGDLVTAITSDVEALEVFFAHTISPVLIATGTTIVTFIFLASYNLLLAIVLLIGQIVVGIFIPIFGYRKSSQLGDDYQAAFVQLNQNVMENVASLTDIDQYQLASDRLTKLDQAGKKLNQQYDRRLKQESFLKIFSETVLLITAIAIFVLANQLHLSSEIVVVSVVLSLSSFGPVLALSGLGSALLTTFASGRRLYQLTNEAAAVTFQNSQQTLANFATAGLTDVSFSYDTKEVLKDLSLSIRHGEIIGIGGESGNGKSTLIKLLMRYWDPQSGYLQMNHHDLKTIDETTLHQIEGVMEQQTFIFEDTLAANIAIGKSTATNAEIKLAAEKAALSEWIETLPDGYNTVIGGNERTVSDGERQRIGLARLFLHDAPFLLLDEPTSNLDYLNEQAILNTLTSELKHKTVLLISHRETTLAITQKQYELTNHKLKIKNTNS